MKEGELSICSAVIGTHNGRHARLGQDLPRRVVYGDRHVAAGLRTSKYDTLSPLQGQNETPDLHDIMMVIRRRSVSGK